MSHRAALFCALALGLSSCATFVPSLRGIWIGDAGNAPAIPLRPTLALLGDIGVPNPDSADLARGLGGRLQTNPAAPIFVLGDVFYSDGLLGMCPAGGTESSRRCKNPGAPRAQFDAVFGPLQNALPQNPVVAIAGNHDHYGDPVATQNACAIFEEVGWQYLAEGCGLTGPQPVAVIGAPGVAIAIIDSQRMINDPAFRAASLPALQGALAAVRARDPDAWRIVASHHPLESYGSHNGASLGTAIHKDLYWLRKTLLWPLSKFAEAVFLSNIGTQDLYEFEYRAYRRGLYRVFANEPVDLVVSGHDHSLQWIALDHPGVDHQLVVGAGSPRSRVKRFGLDLLGSNRLFRALGLADAIPAHAHQLEFAAGGPDRKEARSGRGYAVLTAGASILTVEFYDAAGSEPLYVASLSR